jgi:O-succinylhomoserine sulfhydrylase
METMKLRVEAQSASALAVARHLEGKAGIARVLYPHLDSHPQAAIARHQMTLGGTMVAFDMTGGKEAAFRLLNRLQVIDISNNLGDTKSLMTHPASTTHRNIGEEGRAMMGITPGMLRLSVGLEDLTDLLADLDQALAA